MQNQSQLKILAQAIYEIRLLLSGYLGNENQGDPLVRRATHLSYALHNEALSIIEGGTFDSKQALEKIKAMDRIFREDYTRKFRPHVSDDPPSIRKSG